ncbi:MAG: hypothetical protein ACHQIO_05355 [Nevskiales bacterium]
MIEYRVTKYDPALRDSVGSYVPVEWTSVTDIGSAFTGGTLTPAIYQTVEDAYVSAAILFMEEAQQSSLKIEGLESMRSTAVPPAQTISVSALDPVLRSLLREEYWCRLEGSKSFIHIGWDYYMYVGVPIRCPKAEAAASKLGLFVEPFLSPYRTRRPSDHPTHVSN